MNILIEKINALGLIQSKREVKLSKGKLLITIGDKRFLVNNTEKEMVEIIEKDEPYINPITQYENDES